MTAPYTPQLLAPSAPGQLSNTRGANTGADAIPIKTRQANPKGASNLLSLMRIKVTRTAIGGNPSAPISAWDSCWMGGVPAVQQLTVAKQACGGNSTVSYAGRVYFMPSDGQIVSAPSVGPALGTWRYETPLTSPSTPNNLPTVYSMTIVANRLYAIATAIQPISTQATLYFATINADGTLGAWAVVPGGIVIQSDTTWKNAGCCGGWDGKSATGYLILWNSSLHPTTVTVNVSDGSITAPAVDNGVNPTVLRDNLAFGFVAPGNAANTYVFFLIGGTAAAVSAVVDGIAVNASTGLTSGTYVAQQALPAARTGGTGFLLQNGTVYYMGGSSTIAAGGATTTVYTNTSARINNTQAWTTSAQTLPAARWLAGGGVLSNDYDVAVENTQLPPWVAVIGGQDTAAALSAVVKAAAVNMTATPPDIRAWTAGGVGTALAVGDIGVNASLVNNQDGTQDILVNYGAGGSQKQNGQVVGSLSIQPFLDGDQVTITVQHCNVDGDYSPLAVTVLKIGQAPTVSAIAPSGATTEGRPLLSFTFNPGAGGGAELSYQIQLKQGVTVLFDSGVRYDGLNSIQSLLAPFLATATTYTVLVNVTATDTPASGSSASGTGSTTFTPTLTAPGTPSGLSATPNHSSGQITLNWTNNAPAGTTPGSRVYYRRSGTTPWFVLLDVSAVTAVSFLDRIALATNYDFAVSSVDNATHSESALSNVVTNVKIDPVAGGYSVFLHIQGSSGTQAAPGSHSVALLAQLTPDVKSRLDMRTSLPFQQLAPVARFGVANYSELKIPAFLQDLAHLKSLQDVINTAYAGSVIVYRDGFGAMITMAPMAEAALKYVPPLYREVDINLVQIPDNVGGWSIAIGSAQGYQSQQSGSAIPLDPSEMIL